MKKGRVCTAKVHCEDSVTPHLPTHTRPSPEAPAEHPGRLLHHAQPRDAIAQAQVIFQHGMRTLLATSGKLRNPFK